jgi:hypothetical protein
MNPQLVILKIKELASTPNHGFKKKFKLVKGLVFETLDFSWNLSILLILFFGTKLHS